MNKSFYVLMMALAACSPQNQTESAAAASSGQTASPHQTQPGGEAGVEMTGDIHFSLEQSEFVSQGKTYFIEKSYALIGEIKARRQYSGAYNVTLHNVCIRGRILDKEQNQGGRFGPLGRYGQAVIIEGLC